MGRQGSSCRLALQRGTCSATVGQTLGCSGDSLACPGSPVGQPGFLGNALHGGHRAMLSWRLLWGQSWKSEGLFTALLVCPPSRGQMSPLVPICHGSRG